MESESPVMEIKTLNLILTAIYAISALFLLVAGILMMWADQAYLRATIDFAASVVLFGAAYTTFRLQSKAQAPWLILILNIGFLCTVIGLTYHLNLLAVIGVVVMAFVVSRFYQ